MGSLTVHVITAPFLLQIRNLWESDKELLSTSGDGRGAVTQDDRRLALDDKERKALFDFINGQHEQGKQIFRRTVRESIAEHCGRSLSNIAVGKLLYRLGYRCRRGRMKIPPLNEERKNRIRRFLIEMAHAVKQEDAKEAVIVYMDESFVHQLHGSAYSYFFTDKDGVVQDGMGRKSGKGQRMIMVHAITKEGPLVTRGEGDFPIPEGPFAPKANGRGKQRSGDMGSVSTAECLWQAKHGKGDYHDAMTDKMFMDWLEKRLTPAFRTVFGEHKKMILVLDNAAYHHEYNEEVKVPESNTKKYNTELLQKHGVQYIKVPRPREDGEGKSTTVWRNFEVPEADEVFPQSNSRCGYGVSKEEVALATRAYFQVHHPDKLLEKVEAYMKVQGWELIWTPPYMPSFQPIELFWQHGKQYVSFRCTAMRRIDDVWDQIRKGWYGDPEWDGQTGGWKPANCAKLVEHTIKEMDKWIRKDDILRGTLRRLVVPRAYDKDATNDKVLSYADGIGAQMEAEILEECLDCMAGEDEDDAEI